MGSDEQLNAIHAVDQYLEEIIIALNARGILEKTVWIITADHGGCGTLDGLYGRHYMEVPWIISSHGRVAGIRKNHSVLMPVSNMDSTPTLLYLLGLPQSIQSVGRPVLESFASYSMNDLVSVPGFGFFFDWNEFEISEGLENFTTHLCFKGKERCAKVVQQINHSFVIGFITGVFGIALFISGISLFFHYVRPDSRQRCWGLFSFKAIFQRLWDDFRCCRKLPVRQEILPPDHPQILHKVMNWQDGDDSSSDDETERYSLRHRNPN